MMLYADIEGFNHGMFFSHVKMYVFNGKVPKKHDRLQTQGFNFDLYVISVERVNEIVLDEVYKIEARIITDDPTVFIPEKFTKIWTQWTIREL